MIRSFLKAAFAVAALSLSAPVDAEDAAALAAALDAAAAQDWDTAEAEGRLAGPVAFDVIEWQRLRAGKGEFADYADFATRRADWPGMDLLRRKGEATLDGLAPEKVLAWFADQPPQTPAGAQALIAAELASGRKTTAARVAEAAWRGLDFTAAEQADFLAAHGDLVAPAHGGRMQALLDAGKLDQARAMLPLVTSGTRAVAAARIALQSRAKGVDDLLKAVPERMQASAGLARDRAIWRWRNELEEGAVEIVLDRSTDAESLGDPALWSTLRGQLARFYLRKGDARTAYKLAARHRLDPGGGDWADLEWLSGYAALKLGDAPTALKHFDALRAAVQSPISASRADYWRGRALETTGKAEAAQAAYKDGARYQTAFYGLLCAERAGLPLDPVFTAPETLPDWRGQGFTSNSVFLAAQELQAAGASDLAERFLLHLEESLPNSAIAPLAKLAEDWDNPHLALTLAKRAANAGEVLVSAYYPFPNLTTHDLGVPEELALAIARRESEFDHRVISPVGARGLMQLMPGTAKLMAPKIGEEYQLARLTTDPTYNVRLGSAYLAQLRDEFGASPVLIAAGYNAGPGRPRRWMAEIGDPRVPSVDIVDWVEMIPFAETRNYVMRVAESLPVYRARLGRPDAGPVNFTAELRGRR